MPFSYLPVDANIASKSSSSESDKPLSPLAVGELDTDSKKLTVLLVDDNLELLHMTEIMFSVHGYEVLTADNGDRALELIKQRSDIDVLFSDVVMPGMNGIELAVATRELRPELKIILVSGHLWKISGVACLNDFNFLPKPYSFNDLERFLNKSNELHSSQLSIA